MRQLIRSIAAMFRALVMLAILGGCGYLAIEHTPILEVARQKYSEWQNRQPDYEWGGGAAPAFGSQQAGQTAGTSTPSVDAQPWPQVELRDTESPPAKYAEQQAAYETPTASPGTSDEWEYFTLERRLREMGVSYSMLESDGSEGGRFRFLCRVALPGGSARHRKFEAVASEPVEAMRQVVLKVEQWRTYHGPSHP